MYQITGIRHDAREPITVRRDLHRAIKYARMWALCSSYRVIVIDTTITPTTPNSDVVWDSEQA